MAQLLRWTRRVLSILTVLILIAWIWAEGTQWVLRWRAERLLADVRALEVGKSTWADAERFMQRWQGWKSDNCGQEDCHYTVSIERMYPHSLRE